MLRKSGKAVPQKSRREPPQAQVLLSHLLLSGQISLRGCGPAAWVAFPPPGPGAVQGEGEAAAAWGRVGPRGVGDAAGHRALPVPPLGGYWGAGAPHPQG